MKKIMVVGEFMWPWYQQSVVNALRQIGHNVTIFSWLSFFMQWKMKKSEPEFKNFYMKFQHRFNFGPTINLINQMLIHRIKNDKPDIIFFYNVKLINKKTIIKIKSDFPKVVICQYSNDNPFIEGKFMMWKKYLETIKYFDFTFAARNSDFVNYKNKGAKNIYLLKSYFDPKDDFSEEITNIPEKYKCDVVFAGHYEDDQRLEFLEEIVKNNIKLNLFGGGWNKVIKKSKLFNKINNKLPIEPAIGKNYRYAICGSKIALCFFSKINKDYYTRRNFQIPAMKRIVLCEYNNEISKIFIENEDIIFFRNKYEMCKKIKHLLEDIDFRKLVENNAYKKLYNDKHSVIDRMSYVMSIISK